MVMSAERGRTSKKDKWILKWFEDKKAYIAPMPKKAT
jgi:hypothetical protein